MPGLNPEQQAAVRHDDGPLLILAGAGTGKTRVVTERMARLLRNGLDPKNLLGVTFTNKAAGEMRQRLRALVGKRCSLKDLVIATFHSLAVRIIRRDARLLGYTPSFSICDYGEQMALVRKAASTVRGAATLKPDDALRDIGSLKNRGLSPDDFSRIMAEDDEHVLHAIYRRYQEGLRRQNCLDFDDLLLQCLVLLRNHESALEYWRDRFHHIMVDEFQDTNQVQFDLVRLLAAPRNNLCVVGDDDQSIYAWRGAMAGNILKFRDSFPGAVEITLEQNYRSTSTILSAANAVIRNNPSRRDKNLWSDQGDGAPIRIVPSNDQFEEAEWVARAIRERIARAQADDRRLGWNDFAIIIRANAQSRPFEDEFMAAKIPYRIVGGQSLFERKEARDVISFLSLLVNPDADNQLLRIINVPPRGIGDKTVDSLNAHAVRTNRHLLPLLASPEDVPDLSGKAVDAAKKFHGQIEGWRRRLRENGVDGLVRHILEETSYQDELASLYKNPLDAASRWNEALEVDDSLANYAAKYPHLTPEEALTEYLAEAMLAGRQDDNRKNDNQDSVLIITAHSAKGLEFPHVFIPGLEEDIFPHKNSIEADTVAEERRLFYVAMTRARRELTLTWNRCRVVRGKEQKRNRSRFLDEIPEEFTDAAATPTRKEEALAMISAIRGKLGNGDAAVVQ